MLWAVPSYEIMKLIQFGFCFLFACCPGVMNQVFIRKMAPSDFTGTHLCLNIRMSKIHQCKLGVCHFSLTLVKSPWFEDLMIKGLYTLMFLVTGRNFALLRV